MLIDETGEAECGTVFQSELKINKLSFLIEQGGGLILDPSEIKTKIRL
jgi:hypothetical protein